MSDLDDDVDRVDAREFRWRLWQQLPLLVALVALWMLLWGELSWGSLVIGIVVAISVTTIFYLPPVELSGRFNVFWLVVFLLIFAGQVAAGSIVVAARAFGPRIRRNAIIAVPLRTSSDVIMTMTATVVTLIPGSVVIDIDRNNAVLYVHVFAPKDLPAVERFRAGVYVTERRIVRAIGSKADMERIRS